METFWMFFFSVFFFFAQSKHIKTSETDENCVKRYKQNRQERTLGSSRLLESLVLHCVFLMFDNVLQHLFIVCIKIHN